MIAAVLAVLLVAPEVTPEEGTDEADQMLERLGTPRTAPAPDAPRLEWAGLIQSDVRYVVLTKSDTLGGQRVELIGRRFARNDNFLKLKPRAVLSPKVHAFADVDLVWRGFNEASTLEDLARRERVDPVYVRGYSAYLDLRDLAPGLDLRLGRQVVTWGAADKFSPLNFINARDFDNALLFGDPIGNQMVRLDFSTTWAKATALVIPVFRPGMVPASARYALGSPDRIRVQDARFRGALAGLVALSPPARIDVAIDDPPPTAEDVAAGARVGTQLGGLDLAVSYFRGRSDLPQPVRSVTTTTDDGTIETRATIGFPRFQAAGAELSGELPLGPHPGFWADVGVFFPEEVRLALETPGLGSGEVRQAPDGSVTLDGTGDRPVIVPSRPFVKWTVGADVTLAKLLYVNVQWAHGFLDEFGAGDEVRRASYGGVPEVTWPRIGDYLIAGMDLKLFADKLLVRAFGIWKVGHATGVAYPEVSLRAWDAVELSLGAFLLLGDENTKFGDPAAGGSQAFARAKVSF